MLDDSKVYRILVIDDEALLRKTVGDYLEDMGYEVLEAQNGREGLEVFEREQPEAVLVDLRMPEVDGLEVLEEITKSSPETPVIVVSGVGVLQDVIEALRLGAWDYIRKPVEDMDLLGHALEKTLERARLLRENRIYRDHLEEEVRSRTKDLEDALENLRKYENIVSVTDDLLAFIDKDGLYRAVNTMFLKVFDVAKEDVLGKPLGSFLSEGHFSRELRELFRNCLQGEKGAYSSWLHTSPLGKVYADVRVFPYVSDLGEVDGVVLYVRDMTSAKLTEEKLRESQSTAEALLNAPQDPAYLIDVGGVVLSTNEVGARRLHSTVETLVGTVFFDHFPRQIAARRREKFSEVLRTGVPAHFRDEHAGRYLDTTIYPLFGELGKVERVALFSKDITDRVLAERESDAKKRQLIQADKMTSLGILVSGVAHEINNPTGIITLNAPLLNEIWSMVQPVLDDCPGANERLRDGGMDLDELRERVPFFVEQISDSAERIRRIVAELKDFARADPREELEAVDLNEVVRHAVSLTSNKIKKSTEHFEAVYSSEPIMVTGNFQRLEQVVVNALINSCEALQSTEKGIHVYVEPARKGWGQVRLVDQGRGIAAEDLKHIFDPFFTTKRDMGGTGLGLSVSHGIVQDHGGKLLYTSQEGKGTQMRMILPLDASVYVDRATGAQQNEQ